jgi:stage II sporulation protein R
MTKTDRWILSAGLALCLCAVCAHSVAGFAGQCAAVRGDTLRLHVIANSDSETDQANKLLVRDAILGEYEQILGAAGGAGEAGAIALHLCEDIAVTAHKTLLAQNDDSRVTVSVTQTYFDTREYDDGVILPAGRYNALRVVIGEGRGKNWWCVLYPPLCIPAAMKQPAKDARTRILALSHSPGYKAEFAIVELAEKIREKLT